jgi:hypothetical protein
MCLIEGRRRATVRSTDWAARAAGKEATWRRRAGTAGGRKAAGDATAGTESATVRSFPDREAAGDGLTQRQRRVLEVIRDSIERRGYPPSVREIGEAVGLSSASSVAHQLSVLQKKGWLRRDPNRPRALDVRLPEDSPHSTAVSESAAGGEGQGSARPTSRWSAASPPVVRYSPSRRWRTCSRSPANWSAKARCSC